MCEDDDQNYRASFWRLIFATYLLVAAAFAWGLADYLT